LGAAELIITALVGSSSVVRLTNRCEPVPKHRKGWREVFLFSSLRVPPMGEPLVCGAWRVVAARSGNAAFQPISMAPLPVPVPNDDQRCAEPFGEDGHYSRFERPGVSSRSPKTRLGDLASDLL
jgi:hypothetical protein